jgi:hypothetical protein
MEQEKIKELLRNYYEGLTSEAEEALLKELMNTPGTDEEFTPDRVMMSAGRDKPPEPSEDFITRLEAITGSVKQGADSGRIIRYALSMAAGIALLAGSYFIFRIASVSQPEDTFSDPKIAMAEVRNILTTVSHNMKTGTEPLASIKTMGIAPRTMEDLGKIGNTVGDRLNKLQYLNKIGTSPQLTEDQTKKN